MVNYAALGEGGVGVCLIYCASPISICNSCTCISFKYVALCIHNFSIYIKTIIKGNAGLGILA